MSWASSFIHWYSREVTTSTGAITHPHAELLSSVGSWATFVGAAIAAYATIRTSRAAIRQAQAATRQADAATQQVLIATQRHEEQTAADRQRRITESFAKAIEQLGSDKLEVRVGAIYSLERISRESLGEYWTVMECLTAFVRERTQRAEEKRLAIPLKERVDESIRKLRGDGPEGNLPEEFLRYQAEEFERTLGNPPTLDIDAVITVISRRGENRREEERKNGWVINLEGAILRRANLQAACLEGINLSYAHLEGAQLQSARLSRVDLHEANLTRAVLMNAHLEHAFLMDANLTKANLAGARVKGTLFLRANLEGAYLSHAEGLTDAQLWMTYGDSETTLSDHLVRPENWNPVKHEEPDE